MSFISGSANTVTLSAVTSTVTLTPSVSLVSASTVTVTSTSTVSLAASSCPSRFAVPPVQVLVNPYFGVANPQDPQSTPISWTIQGPGEITALDCTAPYYSYNPNCQQPDYSGNSYVYFVLSTAVADDYYATLSQTVEGLVPGGNYQFIAAAAFRDQVTTCTVTYSLGGTAFAQFAPVNNYMNQLDLPESGPYSVVASSSVEVFSISMSCPHANNNGGYGIFQNATLTGPY
jgi:hypothetical protein